MMFYKEVNYESWIDDHVGILILLLCGLSHDFYLIVWLGGNYKCNLCKIQDCTSDFSKFGEG